MSSTIDPTNLWVYISKYMKIKKQTGWFKSFDGTKIYYEQRGPCDEGDVSTLSGDQLPNNSSPSGQLLSSQSQSDRPLLPLILCCGIGCPLNHWVHQVKYFSPHYETVVFDYRAHFKSEVPATHNLHIEAISQDVWHLMQHLGIEKAHFLTHSFGGQVMTHFFDRYESENRIASLVFINGFASDPIATMFGLNVVEKIFHTLKAGYYKAPSSTKYMWQRMTNNQLSVWLTSLLGGFNINLTPLKDIEIYLKGVAHLDFESFLNLFEAMMHYDGRAVLPRMALPVLIVNGQKDAVTPLSYQKQMHKKLPHSELVQVPYGSHCSHMDMPELVNLKIEKFLKSV